MPETFINNAYSPEELDALRATYDEITATSWFRPTPEAKKGFAKYLFATFSAGEFNRESHQAALEKMARQHYGRQSR